MHYQFLRFPMGKAKAVTFSYDDGCPQDITLSGILSDYGLKCTFNLNSKELCGINSLTKEEIQKNFLEKGHEIAVHGAFHRAEGTLRPIEGIQDVLNCRLELEQTYGTIIRGMAYPDTGISSFSNAAKYESVRQYLSELDIAYARTLGKDNNSFKLPEDWYSWIPTAHHNNPKILDYADEFIKLDLSDKKYGATRYPRLFYVWGHAYEFDRFDNWEHLHELCKKLGNRKDIWYATNIEIYNYVSAYHSLVYSVDSNMIYNPTLIAIWFDRDGTQHIIHPGETLHL